MEEKRGRDPRDEGNNERAGKHPFNPAKPPKILKRKECAAERPEKLWMTLREKVDIEELTRRTLEAPVPGVTVGELSISTEMIHQWFGVKRVPPIKRFIRKARRNGKRSQMEGGS